MDRLARPIRFLAISVIATLFLGSSVMMPARATNAECMADQQQYSDDIEKQNFDEEQLAADTSQQSTDEDALGFDEGLLTACEAGGGDCTGPEALVNSDSHNVSSDSNAITQDNQNLSDDRNNINQDRDAMQSDCSA